MDASFLLKSGNALEFSILDGLLVLNSDFICGQFNMDNIGIALLKNGNNVKLEVHIKGGVNYQGWFFKSEEYLRLFVYFTKLGFLHSHSLPKEIINLPMSKVDEFIANPSKVIEGIKDSPLPNIDGFINAQQGAENE